MPEGCQYAYCLNNPFKYTDPDGEFIHLIIGAVIGGVVNWAMNGAEFSWKGLGYFGVGAAAGALGAGIGSGISSALPIAGQASGGFAAGFLGTSAATTATSSFVSGALIGGGAGLASGFTTGFGNDLLQGGSFGHAVVQQTTTKINGTVTQKLLYYVMNPAGGGSIMRISGRSIVNSYNVFYIY